VWSLFRLLMDVSLLKPIIRPITRLLVGLVAVPLFRSFTKRVLKFDTLDEELEKDLEQWFRGALILLIATQNMESSLFPWVQPVIQARFAATAPENPAEDSADALPSAQTTGDEAAGAAAEAPPPQRSMLEVNDNDYGWILLGLRVMLAISVIQMMPDQELFAVIHSSAPKPNIAWREKLWPQIRREAWPFVKGHICVHLNKSSPVFAILAAIAPGMPGWICYAMALIQYLIIGLVTTRDKALNVLTLFDQEVERRRQELIDEFQLADLTESSYPAKANPTADPAASAH
jgi:hypothetical protein